jgi:hypothetical protein
VTNDGACEYGRCGGLGAREVAGRRLARRTVFAAGRWWRACESCSALLLRRARGRGSHGTGPVRVGDVLWDALDDRPERR